MRILLVAATTGYQVREFSAAAEELGDELVLATDRCHVLPDPWGDGAAPIDFRDPEPWLAALAERGPFDGILAVGDRPAQIAAQIAEHYGLRFHSSEATRATGNKLLARERFRDAGLPAPAFRQLNLEEAAQAEVRYPCVLKPLDASASRGVIRANDRGEFLAAARRLGAMLDDGPRSRVLVEDYIPGREFALEGVVTGGALTMLALFDKPDPLEGPFFEETIYVTPSREPESVQRALCSAAQQAIRALALSDGPVHAEMRVNGDGVWMLEVAARPIGGLCARVLRFTGSSASGPPIALEKLLLLHAGGRDVSRFTLAPGAHGVMMIPIPGEGIYQDVHGVEEAAATPDIEDIVITAKKGQKLTPLPEGSSYLGFLFARAATPSEVEQALRTAHGRLAFQFMEMLPVVE